MAQNISPDFPFDSKFLDVLGSKMHYVEEYSDASNQEQLTYLFLHGNPTSTYLWRNIIPYVDTLGKAVAVDLIGMGKSGKPDIGYTFQDHSEYLEKFIELKELKNIVLVLHDWGSGLGFHYASRNEENIVGIVFMEAITQPASWSDANIMERILFKRFRHEKKGYKMLAEKNFFIKTFLFKLGINRKLSDLEKDHYSAPYQTVASRKPIAIWPREIPFDGEPERNYIVIKAYAEWLENTSLPKLLLYVRPGMILKKGHVERIKRDYKSLDAVYVGRGKHYIQEDHPHEIGTAIKNWAKSRVESANPLPK